MPTPPPPLRPGCLSHCPYVCWTSGQVEVRPRYLVAADGAHSAVREQCGVALHGEPSLEDFISIHFKCEALWRLMGPDRGAMLYFVFNAQQVRPHRRRAPSGAARPRGGGGGAAGPGPCMRHPPAPPPPQVLTDSLGGCRIRTSCSCPPPVRPLLSGWLILYRGGGGGVRGQKKFVYLESTSKFGPL